MSKRGNILVYSQLHLDFGPFLQDKIEIVFETSKPKIVWSQFLFGKHLSALETIIRPLHLISFAFVHRGIMALQQEIDKKNTFLFIWWILSSFYPGQMLSAAPLKIFPSWTKS